MVAETLDTRNIPEVITPPEDLNMLLDVRLFLNSHEEPAMLLGPDGQQTPLPGELYRVLTQAVAAMQSGASVSIQRVDRQLTTQQAADLLGVSRMTIVRLLDQSELPFERLGKSGHRRIRLKDLLAYRQRKRQDNFSRLAEMTRQAVEDGLYDVDADAYTDALRSSRKRG